MRKPWHITRLQLTKVRIKNQAIRWVRFTTTKDLLIRVCRIISQQLRRKKELLKPLLSKPKSTACTSNLESPRDVLQTASSYPEKSKTVTCSSQLTIYPWLSSRLTLVKSNQLTKTILVSRTLKKESMRMHRGCMKRQLLMRRTDVTKTRIEARRISHSTTRIKDLHTTIKTEWQRLRLSLTLQLLRIEVTQTTILTWEMCC